MIRISQIRLRPDHSPADLHAAVAGRLHVEMTSKIRCRVVKQSIDARKKPDIFYVYTVDVTGFSPGEERRILRRAARDRNIASVTEKPYQVPEHGTEPAGCRPVIVGSGPAGLFCALLLAGEGYRPLVIERGEPVRQRAETVRRFWDTNDLDPDSNVQFGEGGAGTFSDGKLNTGIKDPSGRIRFVLETFVRAGADEDILYSYKPHIGTDRLRDVIEKLRGEIISLGGEFLFSHRLEGIEYTMTEITAGEKLTGKGHMDTAISRDTDGSDGSRGHAADNTLKPGYILGIKRLKADRGEEERIRIRTNILVLALGHSARDTFEMLLERGIQMQPKAFAVGVRIQHPQQMIDDAMYGKDCRYPMPPSPYRLACQLEQGGVYSFCMCPGGYVVNASSEPGMIAVNGMSLRDRDSGSANSAIVMTVSPGQCAEYMKQWAGGETPGSQDSEAGSGTSCAGCAQGGAPGSRDMKAGAEAGQEPEELHPLTGLAFVRMLERRAWEAGQGFIPTQSFFEFCGCGQDRPGEGEAFCEAGRKADRFLPRIEGRHAPADVRSIFPEEIGDGLEEAIRRFDRVIPGFASPAPLLCAPESRTSSPVRLVRDPESLEAVSHPGIYPCGEGAGYAGGITSAAVDGLRVAEAVIRRYRCDVNAEDVNADTKFQDTKL